MVSAITPPVRSRWWGALCAVAILFGLTAHLVGDATFRSPDLASLGNREAAGGQLTTCSLLSGLVLPAAIMIGTLLTLVRVLALGGPAASSWLPAPPVHPPAALR